MGYMRHHAIIVTSYEGSGAFGLAPPGQDLLDIAHAKAKEIFAVLPHRIWVSPISHKAINGYRSFFVAPDGSKEGWDESERGDARRDQFVEWLDAQLYKDHSTPFAWVEVQYGDGDLETKICRDSDAQRRAAREAK